MMTSAVSVAIALGSNLGDREATLRRAVADVSALDEVTLRGETPVEETLPIGPPQPMYLNQMILVDTTVSLFTLLAALHDIEARHGRVRGARMAPRTLDLDIVWAQDRTITSRELLVPHPGLCTRDFWQRELAFLLGTDFARQAIAAAHVHAGLDTARPSSLS